MGDIIKILDPVGSTLFGGLLGGLGGGGGGGGGETANVDIGGAGTMQPVNPGVSADIADALTAEKKKKQGGESTTPQVAQRYV